MLTMEQVMQTPAATPDPGTTLPDALVEASPERAKQERGPQKQSQAQE